MTALDDPTAEFIRSEIYEALRPFNEHGASVTVRMHGIGPDQYMVDVYVDRWSLFYQSIDIAAWPHSTLDLVAWVLRRHQHRIVMAFDLLRVGNRRTFDLLIADRTLPHPPDLRPV